MTTYRYRSAVTGRFVKAGYAKRYPHLTVRERPKPSRLDKYRILGLMEVALKRSAATLPDDLLQMIEAAGMARDRATAVYAAIWAARGR